MPLGPSKNTVADSLAGTALVTTAETVIATLPAIDLTPEGDQVLLEGYCQLTTGAATTALQLRIRRGTVTGTQVGATAQQALGAAAQGQVSIQTLDTPPESAGIVYVLTAQQVSATGNGTVAEASLQGTY